jgi:protein involved in polysaccharide export with SLBB domain
MRRVLFVIMVVFVVAVLAISLTDSSAFAAETVKSPPPAYAVTPILDNVEAMESAKVPFPSHWYLEPTDIITVEATHLVPKDPEQQADMKQIVGNHTLGPDGYITLGTYGRVYVNGLTVNECRDAIEFHLGKHFDKPQMAVNVLLFNSKVYYVVVQLPTTGNQVNERLLKFPCTGNETVLDAITNVYPADFQPNSSTRIWIARPVPNSNAPVVLPVFGKPETNYQLLPNDKVYVNEERFLSSGGTVARRVSLLERIRFARR